MASASKTYPNPKTEIASSTPWRHMEPPPNFFPSKSELLRLAAVLVISASVAMTCNFFVTLLYRQPTPFCDSDAGSYGSMSDSCDPCPINGQCQDGKLQCVLGYRKYGKLCIEDGDISETAKKLSDFLESHVCGAYAQYLCEGTGTVWLQEDVLFTNLGESKVTENDSLDNQIYVYAKQRALEAIGKILEARTNVHGVKEFKCPDWLVERYKPFACRIREWIIKHASILVPLCALFVGGTILLLKVCQKHYLSIRAEQLYNQVCEILEKKALTSRSLNDDGEPWVVASRLRDHLLLPKERKDRLLWKKVVELVQEDSRLDQYPKLVKGESKVVWEWQVEGTLSSTRKRNKGEENKLKVSDGVNTPPSQQHWKLNSRELLNS